jgi:hypothetical protein
MKRWVILTSWIAMSSASWAQEDNFFAVDNRALSFPSAVTNSTAELANHIYNNFRTDETRARAAYRWVTANIRYDKDSMLYINWSKEYDDKIAATLRRKKGVCDNFASVFTDLLLKMNIPAFVVNGNCRTGGGILAQPHSWAAVKMKEQWLLCDPTWDIGYSNSTRYFLIEPEVFIESHWPFDPLWQLLPYKMGYAEFEKGLSYRHENEPQLNILDSVNAFMSLDKLQQMESAARRMKTSGAAMEAQKNWYGYNQMNIAIAYGEKNMQLYNDAVQELNKASKFFNNFAAYRNDMFVPARPDDEIKKMLQPVKELIQGAKKKAMTIASSKENFQYDPGDLVQKLNALDKKVEDQLQFLQRYIATGPAERQKLFYQ